MKKLYSARYAAIILALFVASVMERFLTVAIAGLIGITPENFVYHAISMFVLIFIFVLTNSALKLFVHSKVVTRLCFGNEFVGGRWIEFITYDDGRLSHCSVLDLIYEEDKVGTHGVAYRYQDGKFKLWYVFRTTKSEMSDYKLSYTFSAEGAVGDPPDFTDEGALYFVRNVKSRPNELYGRIKVRDKDDNIKERKRISGYWIKNKKELKDLNKSQPSALLKIAQRLSEEHNLGLDFNEESSE